MTRCWIGILEDGPCTISAALASRLRHAVRAQSRLGDVRLLHDDRPDPEAGPAKVSCTADSQISLFRSAQRLVTRGASVLVCACPAPRKLRDMVRQELGVRVVDWIEILAEELHRRLPRGGSVVLPGRSGAAFEGRLRDHMDRRYRIARHGMRGERDDTVIVAFGPLDNSSAKAVEPTEFGRLDPFVLCAQQILGPPPKGAPALALLGIVGGVGPAATIDFLAKIVANSPARCDQDHIQIVLEHNPKIPDRTAFLLHGGDDPTLALYAACHRLEMRGARAIAIPCNTAHALIARVQAHLCVPIVDMIELTAHHVASFYPAGKIALLATSGTLASALYQRALERQGLQVIVPPAPHQRRVMNAIYGPRGVKADFSREFCTRQLSPVLHAMFARGAKCVILGCTELPLILRDACHVHGQVKLDVIDPTTLLARKCIELVNEARPA